jgi:hypothetical protein
MEYNFDYNWDKMVGAKPYITISLVGISFNKAALRQMGYPNLIKIGCDAEKLAIGVTLPELVGTNPRPISIRLGSGGWARVGCKSFVEFLQSETGIDFSKAKRYDAKFVRISDGVSGLVVEFLRE